MNKTLSYVLLALTLSACTTVSEPAASHSGTVWDRLVPRLIAEEKVAGIGIAVIEDGRTTQALYYGEQEPGIAVDEMTVFNTASVAKTVASELYIELDDRGLIDLDAPIAHAIQHTDLSNDERFALLTPRILFAHTSGLRNWAYAYEDGKLAFDRAPGEAFGYSGAGIEIAADYASAKIGQSYRALVHQYVLKPQGIEQLSPGKIHLWMEGHLAKPMDGNGQWTTIKEANPKLAEGRSDAAADDLLTTVPAYAKFLEQVIADTDNHALRTGLQSSVLETDNYACREELTPICPRAAGHSFGWQVNRYADHDVVFHSGSDAGEIALAYFSPQTRNGAVIFVNGVNGWVPTIRIVEALGQEPLFADYIRGIIADILGRDLPPLPSKS